MLALSVSAVWFLALLGAAVLGRDATRGLVSLLMASLAFLLVLPLALWLSPQPNWIAVLVGIAAGWRLVTGRSPRAGPLLAGAIAALAAALATAAGVSPLLAAPLTALSLVVALLLRKPAPGADGSPSEILLVLVALATPFAGLLADLLYGWQSAAMLSRDAIEVAAPAPPLWALGITGLALLAGLIRGLSTKR